MNSIPIYISNAGKPGGIATLDSNGKIPESQLPSGSGGGSDSGGSGVLVVPCTVSDNAITATKTAGEIYTAIQQMIVYFVYPDDYGGSATEGFMCETLLGGYIGESGYLFPASNNSFEAATADDYPSMSTL